MIDLHLHTTASDGRATPEDLAVAARRARLTVVAVTDHDTVAALDRMKAACAAEGLMCVPGIEITSLHHGSDLHVLGYFFDHRSPRLTGFLETQLEDRHRRVGEMIARLADLGLVLDADEVLRSHAESDARWIGRPLLARALVRAGHVRSMREAFDLYLTEGGAAWVPRRAPSPLEVISLIHDVKGLASLAHPGLVGHDEWIDELAAAGLDALEVYYSEHTPEMTAHYRDVARTLGLAMSGGSDYHGDPSHGPERPGSVTLPVEAFDELRQRAELAASLR
ncbi:MAG TPA: PHP domain-containing protein [Vicinamibacterales bacterium]